MPITLNLKVHTDYLEAEFIGNRDEENELEESIRIGTEIPLVCEAHGLHKIMAISRLNRRLKLDNTFNFTERFDTIGWKPEYKLAGVIYDEELRMEYEVMATFIRNFGYPCRVFNSIKEAKNWLLNF